jgi:hypothetical protein
MCYIWSQFDAIGAYITIQYWELSFIYWIGGRVSCDSVTEMLQLLLSDTEKSTLFRGSWIFVLYFLLNTVSKRRECFRGIRRDVWRLHPVLVRKSLKDCLRSLPDDCQLTFFCTRLLQEQKLCPHHIHTHDGHGSVHSVHGVSNSQPKTRHLQQIIYSLFNRALQRI